MSPKGGSAIVVGAGIFGVTTALELCRRKWQVNLIDPGPLPHPLAASTDVSKIIRLAYGTDEIYTELMEEAISTWRDWNGRWPAPPYHETGILMLTGRPMAAGEFEYESFQVLEKRGRHPNRLTPADVRRRFPAWRAQAYPDGFHQAEGGYAEGGRVVARLAAEGRTEGVTLREGDRFAGFLEEGSRVGGVLTENGEKLLADRVVLAAGAWTPKLLPHLAPVLRPTAHPVFFLKPPNTRLYTEKMFPVFTADIARTGWYGFPLNREGVVKIARHGPGRAMDPDGDREPRAEEERSLRRFLEETFPTLAPLPIAQMKLCLYCDTPDEHFWIDEDPDRPGLVVASGGSGHAFKFAPVLGRLVADVVEERSHRLRGRFRWRPQIAREGREEARCHAQAAPAGVRRATSVR